MSDDYKVYKDIPIISSSKRRTGLTAAIRGMSQGDCLILPAGQISSAHACAAVAGAKVTTRRNDDGTVTVWRTDTPVVFKTLSASDRDIFGLEAAAAAAAAAASNIFE